MVKAKKATRKRKVSSPARKKSAPRKDEPLMSKSTALALGQFKAAVHDYVKSAYRVAHDTHRRTGDRAMRRKVEGVAKKIDKHFAKLR